MTNMAVSRILPLVPLLLACVPLTASAEDGPDSAANAVAGSFAGIDSMLRSIESLPEWDHDALLFRIDEEILELHATLDALTASLAASDSETPAAAVSEATLRQWLERALALSRQRIDELGERIHIELSTYDDFADSPETIISRAFVQDLRTIRLRHLNATLDQLEGMQALGLPGGEDVRAWLEASLELTAQRLVGQIRLDAMTLGELRERVASDPNDPTLRTALRAVERKQMASLDTMDAVIQLQARLGNDTTELRALQARERGLIGAEILDGGVFLHLMQERLQLLRDDILVQGPVWTLRLLAFTAVLLLTWLVARGARWLVHRITAHESVELGQLRERTLVSLSFAVVLLVGTVLALSALGVSLVPMLAGLGVASIIVGLALQESLGNLAAGGMILATRPFDLNDRIRVGDSEGRVTDMNLVATTIASQDNKLHVIPNRQIWNSAITNFSRAKRRRVDIRVSVPSGSDLARLERMLGDIVDDEKRILREPPPQVHFGDSGESADSFWVRAWVETPEFDEASIALRRRIFEDTRKAGIEIAST